jgi:uridine phosphorylase
VGGQVDELLSAKTREKRRYVAPIGGSPSEHVISSAEVLELGAHEVVRVWSRGGLAGELVVGRGDGARLCCVMMMLEPEAT